MCVYICILIDILYLSICVLSSVLLRDMQYIIFWQFKYNNLCVQAILILTSTVVLIIVFYHLTTFISGGSLPTDM